MPKADCRSPLDEKSQLLLARFRAGDVRAAEEIYNRYAQRLLGAARRRLSRRLAARIDAEDVVQSAYRSFFRRASGGDYELQRGGDLWRLLVRIVLHKLLKQVEHHTAAKRSVRREVAAESQLLQALQLACRQPSAEQTVALADELAQVLSLLSEVERSMFEMRLQGCEYQEIALETARSERTVRRFFSRLKQLLNERFAAATAPNRAAAVAGPGEESNPETPLRYDDYRLLRMLGAGGMGKAYAAIDERSNRSVAVKVLHKARLDDEQAVDRFAREARIVSRLEHRNIVKVHGLGRLPDGGHFMVFDLVEGRDLSQVIRQRIVQPDEACKIVASVAEAIEHAHRQGVIHCDLKPSNVLLDAQGRVAVTDFGLARVCATSDEQRSFDDREYIAGTAGYMAPEQIDASFGAIGPRTDVYGLGGILYSLFAGRPPYEGATADAILAKVTSQSERPRLLCELRADASAALSELCARCLAKRPEDRYASARAFADALIRI